MRRSGHSRSGIFKTAFVLICVASYIGCARSAYAQTRPADERENDDARSFLRSVAATIYKFAWPTATYKQIEFAGFQRETDGLAVVAKLSGEGLLGDNLWLKLGIVLNGDGIKDVRVLGHNALLAGPFETSKAMANLLAELGQQYSKSRPTPMMVEALCITNSTNFKIVFTYRWGDANWQAGEIEAQKATAYWWTPASGQHGSPEFDIRFDNDLAPGYTETAFWLERTPVKAPVNCSEAKRYVFSVDGNTVLLTTLR